MLVLIIAVAMLLLVAAALFLPGSPAAVRSTIGRVRAGAFAELLADRPAIDPALIRDVEHVLTADEETVADDPAGPTTGASGDSNGGRGKAVGDAAVPATLAGVVGIENWLHPDQQVLEAVSQATHDHVANGLDLWREVHEHHYDLLSSSSLANWRGHVGEQQVADHLHSWLGDRVKLEELSNHPGSDLSIDGHDFNVKVSADYSNVGPDHFAQYPGTPIIINSDAAHLPADALHVDLAQPFDPSILDGHAVIVADGLHLSGIEASLGDSFGDVIGGHLDLADVLSDLQDAGIPVIGSAIRVVRSGIRENKLRGVHGDTGRMIKNVATDVVIVGTGVATGQIIGHAVGGAIDLLTLGTTAGLGTVAGGIIGAGVGGLLGNKAATSVRLQPFHDAQHDARQALATYDACLNTTEAKTEREWNQALAESRERCEAAEAALRASFDDKVDRARRAFRAQDLIGIDAARRHLATARRCVDESAQRERTILARRRARHWRAAAAIATTSESIFDVVLAAPGGAKAVNTLVEEVRHRRELAIVTLSEAARLTARSAMQIRAREAGRLAATRSGLQARAVDRLADPLAQVASANERVLSEARAAGLLATADE